MTTHFTMSEERKGSSEPLMTAMRPRTWEEFGDADRFEHVRRRFHSREGISAFMFAGLPGRGKTTLALLLAHEASIPPFITNASDKRRHADVFKLLQRVKQETSRGRDELVAVVLDEIDGAGHAQLSYRNFLADVDASSIAPTRLRVLFTCNAISNIDEALLSWCATTMFHVPSGVSMERAARAMLARMGVSASDDAVRLAVKAAQGDYRDLANALQVAGEMARARGDDTIDEGDLEITCRKIPPGVISSLFRDVRSMDDAAFRKNLELLSNLWDHGNSGDEMLRWFREASFRPWLCPDDRAAVVSVVADLERNHRITKLSIQGAYCRFVLRVRGKG